MWFPTSSKSPSKASPLYYRGFRQGDSIFDIGAHQGSKTATFLGQGARVVATEPDEVMLHRCADKSIEVFWKASSPSGR